MAVTTADLQKLQRDLTAGFDKKLGDLKRTSQQALKDAEQKRDRERVQHERELQALKTRPDLQGKLTDAQRKIDALERQLARQLTQASLRPKAEKQPASATSVEVGKLRRELQTARGELKTVKDTAQNVTRAQERAERARERLERSQAQVARDAQRWNETNRALAQSAQHTAGMVEADLRRLRQGMFPKNAIKDLTEGHTHASAAAVTDHGALTGLTDNDHTIYVLKSILTTTGDLYYASAASTPARLGIGTSGQFLRTSAGGIPEWVAAPSGTIVSPTARASVIRSSAAPAWEELLSGLNGTLLYDNGTDVAWTGAANAAALLYQTSTFLIRNDGVAAFEADAYGATPGVLLARAGGTIATPTNIGTGLSLGDYTWQGYETSFAVGARLRAVTAEAWGTGAHGTKLELATIPIGSSTLTLALTVKDNGDLDVVQNILMAAGKTVDGIDISAHDHGAAGGVSHNILSATHADALAASVVRGDILVGNSTPAWARLPLGTTGGVLGGSAAGDVAWLGLLDVTETTISGDMFTYSGHHHVLSSESGTSDDCTGSANVSISGGFLYVSPASGHTITLKHNSAPAAVTKRFRNIDSADIVMSSSTLDWVLYWFSTTLGGWQEILRSPNLQLRADASEVSYTPADDAAWSLWGWAPDDVAEALDNLISNDFDLNDTNQLLQDATYLTTTPSSGLINEVVVGTTPGGELGGTWASPTVDATHSGSAHHAEAHGISAHTAHANWKSLYTDGSGDEQELSLGAAGTFYRSAGAAAAPTMSALVAADLPPLYIFSAPGGKPTTTSGCAALAAAADGTNDVDYDTLDFDAATQEYGTWQPIPMMVAPAGGTFTAKFYWTTAASSGNVIWGIQLACRADDAAIDAAWGTAVEVTDGFLAAGDAHISAATAAITPAGSVAAGNLLFIRVYRKAADGSDTLNGDAKLISVTLS